MPSNAKLKPYAEYSPGSDSHPAKRKEHAFDLTEAFLAALAKIDRKLAESVRAPLIPHIASWKLESREDSRSG